MRLSAGLAAISFAARAAAQSWIVRRILNESPRMGWEGVKTCNNNTDRPIMKVEYAPWNSTVPLAHPATRVKVSSCAEREIEREREREYSLWGAFWEHGLTHTRANA